MKTRLTGILTLAILLTTLLSPFSPPAAKAGEVWELSTKVVKPSDGSWEQGPYSLTASETGITLSDKYSGGGYRDLRNRIPQGPYTKTYNFKFDVLPETLVPGETVKINLSGTGSISGDDPGVEQHNKISLHLVSSQIEPYMTFDGGDSIIDFLVTTNDSNKKESFSFTVPPVVPNGSFDLKIE